MGNRVSGSTTLFGFRPWVRRAALSIVLTAAGLTALVAAGRGVGGRWGWAGEPAVLLYLAVIWAAALRISGATLLPLAEVSEQWLVLRPLHQLRRRRIAWDRIRGTEQMTGGDRLIVYY
ncbi:MAG TPA: hypothetical protein VMS56_13965, partial [Thermoanaerobaculia bacterium]|nr:hypothetical protein [Thermoanaerobaculia bacterium]